MPTKRAVFTPGQTYAYVQVLSQHNNGYSIRRTCCNQLLHVTHKQLVKMVREHNRCRECAGVLSYKRSL